VNKTVKLLFAILLCLAAGMRGVSFGAALFVQRDSNRITSTRPAVPRPVSFREIAGRGLLVQTWINSAGPFTFAIDTGAGAMLLSPRVATEARATLKDGRGASIAGLSGVTLSAQVVAIRSIAIGDSENRLPATGNVIVATQLPRDIDGVLDPTEVFFPLGYVIDIPRHELSAFDPHIVPLKIDQPPAEGTIVTWLQKRNSRRPFVQLDNGDRALLDTGSSLGLAIKDSADVRGNPSLVRDVGGGRVSARRVQPMTVAVGSLSLRNVPTDIISGAEADAPVLLGLSALRPFTLSFDPLHHLIEIAPSQASRRQ